MTPKAQRPLAAAVIGGEHALCFSGLEHLVRLSTSILGAAPQPRREDGHVSADRLR